MTKERKSAKWGDRPSDLAWGTLFWFGSAGFYNRAYNIVSDPTYFQEFRPWIEDNRIAIGLGLSSVATFYGFLSVHQLSSGVVATGKAVGKVAVSSVRHVTDNTGGVSVERARGPRPTPRVVYDHRTGGPVPRPEIQSTEVGPTIVDVDTDDMSSEIEDLCAAIDLSQAQPRVKGSYPDAEEKLFGLGTRTIT